MQISKREFLKNLGLLAATGAAGAAGADEFVPGQGEKLPAGSIGDPQNPSFGRMIFPHGHTIEDGPSCFMRNGEVFRPESRVPIFHKTDVAVVGGGPAGFAAAIAAARTGAKVALVEKNGSLGGLFTNGMVLIMLATSVRRESGDWEVVSKGVCEEFMLRARALGAYASTGERPANIHWQPTVDPEGAKYLMDEMCREAGVEVFFHAYGVDTIQDGDRTLGVVFQSKQGVQAILAKQVVDTTGDGDIFFAAGCGYRQITHGIGFTVRLGNIDRVTATRPPEGKGGGHDGLVRQWPTRGNMGNRSSWWGANLGKASDGLDVRQVSRAEMDNRKFWWEHVADMRKTPGWEQVYLSSTCSQIGPRTTRLLDSELIVDRAAEAAKRNEKDIVGWFGNCGPHNGMALPLAALLPKKGENVVAAGRCIGAPDTTDTFRLICPCFVSGQAAGTVAALAAKVGVSPRMLRYENIARELKRQKAYLG